MTPECPHGAGQQPSLCEQGTQDDEEVKGSVPGQSVLAAQRLLLVNIKDQVPMV